MKKGEILEVQDSEGGIYEAVIRTRLNPRIWAFEWVAGPNDGKEGVIVDNTPNPEE